MSAAFSAVVWVGLVLAVAELVRVHRGLPRSAGAGDRSWWALLLAAFGITWTFMIAMTLEDIGRYPDLPAWFARSTLFLDAYRRVTGAPASWWWSSQIIAFALVCSVVFVDESASRRLPAWAYVWLGMSVALSVALSLFFMHAGRAPRTDADRRASWTLALGTVAAAGAVLSLPILPDRLAVATLILHAAVLAPALAAAVARPAPRPRLFTALCGALAIFCLGIHAWATVMVVKAGSAQDLLRVVMRDPAQASITADLGMTVLACTLFVARRSGRHAAALFAATAVPFSLGTAFSTYLLRRGQNT